MLVNVKSLTGESASCELSPAASVAELKAKLLPHGAQRCRLFSGGAELPDSAVLAECGGGAALDLRALPELRGGGFGGGARAAAERAPRPVHCRQAFSYSAALPPFHTRRWPRQPGWPRQGRRARRRARR